MCGSQRRVLFCSVLYDPLLLDSFPTLVRVHNLFSWCCCRFVFCVVISTSFFHTGRRSCRCCCSALWISRCLSFSFQFRAVLFPYTCCFPFSRMDTRNEKVPPLRCFAMSASGCRRHTLRVAAGAVAAVSAVAAAFAVFRWHRRNARASADVDGAEVDFVPEGQNRFNVLRLHVDAELSAIAAGAREIVAAKATFAAGGSADAAAADAARQRAFRAALALDERLTKLMICVDGFACNDDEQLRNARRECTRRIAAMVEAVQRATHGPQPTPSAEAESPTATPA